MSIVVLDKTGTLTHGRPIVETFNVQQTDNLDVCSLLRKEAISLVASLEQASVHPIAKAVVQYADQTGAPRLEYAVEENEPGGGMCGTVADKYTVRVGTSQYVYGENAWQQRAKDGGTALCAYFEIDNGRLRGSFELSDETRGGCIRMVQQLQQVYSLRCIILSGDRSGGLSRCSTALLSVCNW